MPKTLRAMEITTPLGDDVLLFYGMHAREELGRLSEYQLDLLSQKNDINPDDILGQERHREARAARRLDALLQRLRHALRAGRDRFGRYVRYSAVVHPWLWFLTRTADCRIFQEMTVPDIVKKVFGDHPTADFKFELTGTLPQVELLRAVPRDRLQLRQPADGGRGASISTSGTPTAITRVVLTDSTSKHTATPGYEKISFIAPEQLVKPELEHISSWDFSREIQPGVYVHDDYDLERPSVELKTRKVLLAQLRAERLRDLRLPRALPAEAGRRAVRGRAHRRVRQRSSRRREASSNSRGHSRRLPVHARGLSARRSERRASDRVGELRPGVQRLRGDAGQAPARATAAAS